MEIPEEKNRFIPKGFELGTTLSYPNRSIPAIDVNTSFYHLKTFDCVV